MNYRQFIFLSKPHHFDFYSPQLNTQLINFLNPKTVYKKVQQLIVLTICYQKLKAEGYWTIDMEYNSNENVIIYCKDGHSNINSGINI